MDERIPCPPGLSNHDREELRKRKRMANHRTSGRVFGQRVGIAKILAQDLEERSMDLNPLEGE